MCKVGICESWLAIKMFQTLWNLKNQFVIILNWDVFENKYSEERRGFSNVDKERIVTEFNLNKVVNNYIKLHKRLLGVK